MIFGKSFEWSESKERENIRKHRIDFEKAKLVFADPYKLKKYDVEHSVNEARWRVLGRVGRVLLVIYTERGKQVRIISARLATKKERSIYDGQNGIFGIKTW
jgi:uncharacterized DUF497 family protein